MSFSKKPMEQLPYLRQVRLRNRPPLLDTQAIFQPGLNIVIGKSGTGKSAFLLALENLANLQQRKYEGVGSELVVGGKTSFTITLTEKYKSLAHLEQQFRAGRLSREAFETLATMLPRGRDGKMPLLVAATKGPKTGDDYSLAAALRELGQHRSLYTLKAIGPTGPPAQLLFVEKPAVFKSFKRPFGLGEQLDCLSFQSATAVHSQLPGQVLRSTLPDRWPAPSLAASTEALPLSQLRTMVQQAMGKYLNWLNRYLSAYSPIRAVRLSEQFRVSRDAETDDLLLENVVLEYQLGDAWLPFSALADSVKRIFYLIGEVSAVPPDKPEILLALPDYHKIVLLDEPTSGLSAKKQRRLLQFIRQAAQAYQVILATAAPQVLDMLSASELDRIQLCGFTPEQGTQLRPLSRAQQEAAAMHLARQCLLSDWYASNIE